MSCDEVKAFASRIKKLFVYHEEVNRIWKRFDALRLNNDFDLTSEEEGDPRHLFFIGLSGVGKSQIGRRYASGNPSYLKTIGKEQVKIAPVLYVKLPYPFTQYQFYTEILVQLGTHNLRRDLRINEIKERALFLLRKQQTEMIIFDEMNFILRSKRFDNQEAMEMFKDLTYKTHVCMVCMGTPQILKLRNMEDEYIGRFGVEQMNRFESCDSSFCSLLEQIEKEIKPPKKIGLGDLETGYPQLLHYYCQGRVRYLHLIIKEAYRLMGLFDGDIQDVNNLVFNVDNIREAKYNLFRESDHLVEPENGVE
jgi:hypothetical protein